MDEQLPSFGDGPASAWLRIVADLHGAIEGGEGLIGQFDHVGGIGEIAEPEAMADTARSPSHTYRLTM